MLKTMKKVSLALALLLTLISPLFAQQAGTTAAAKSDSDFVTEKGFKSMVFQVKYRDTASLGNVLRPLGSGFKGASVSPNAEFKTITVRDFPENVAIIEEALKRLDVPTAPRPNIELHMYVLMASNANATTPRTAELPAELKDVVTQLRETLSYRNYELAASIVQRLTETQRGLQGTGTAEITGVDATASLPMPYEYTINQVSLVQNATGSPSVQINEFTFGTHTDKDRARVQTALNLRDGEKVVVGTATIRNRALVIVLTAKLIR